MFTLEIVIAVSLKRKMMLVILEQLFQSILEYVLRNES